MSLPIISQLVVDHSGKGLITPSIFPSLARLRQASYIILADNQGILITVKHGKVELQIGLKDYDTQRDKRFAGATWR